jgi:hypothetical protein
LGGVNPTIQLAAVLDRRGITVSVDGERINIHLGTPRKYIVIQGWAPRVDPCDIGRYWFWDYAGKAGQHPRDDYEGTADAIEKFIRDDPGLADTRLIYRMNHMGWTQEQEMKEILERGRKENRKGVNEYSGIRKRRSEVNGG